MELKPLRNSFNEIFQTDATPRFFFAPGRINLIGEHTDYNGGHVFPASISFGTYALAIKRTDTKFRVHSLNFPDSGTMEFDLNDLSYDTKHDWANYPKGMIKYVKEESYPIMTGADILFYGNIPNGAGLSSSASIEMVTGVVLEKLYDLDIDRVRMIQIGQKVENNFIGVNSGIMDQFAIGKGKKDHAILLDCNTLDYRYAPIKLDKHVIIIINTNKRRELAASKYNERRNECERALSDLQTELDISSLGELSVEKFEDYKHLIKCSIDRKRAKHAVYENERTLEALVRLKEGNIVEFGRLMNQSHLSLQKDYEVTGMELDTIVEAAWFQEGVLGARMTGAGFGGCAIAIVPNDKVESFQSNVNNVYRDKVGYDATFYVATIGDGAKEFSGEEVL